ncbi:MAG: hypothetical protein RL383_1385, partial [Actinomycetota bacterium]
MTVEAFIDVGTNSTNLLVTDGGSGITRRIAVTRLGEGLHSSGLLSPAAIERTVSVIAQHTDTARTLGANTVTVVGTAACRRAHNTSELVAAVHDATGLVLEVISPEEEARLSFIGAVRGLPGLDTEGDVMVVDIGGGSTEISIGADIPRTSFSIPIGAVTATESDLTTDPPRPEDLTNVIGAVQDELEEIGRTAPGALTAGRAVGVA